MFLNAGGKTKYGLNSAPEKDCSLDVAKKQIHFWLGLHQVLPFLCGGQGWTRHFHPHQHRSLPSFFPVPFLVFYVLEIPNTTNANDNHDRSIYPDEFDNFVERMRVMSMSKSKKYLFDMDVMDPMLGVVLDTDLGADLSRERWGTILRVFCRGMQAGKLSFSTRLS